jgi:WD40 repeat protein
VFRGPTAPVTCVALGGPDGKTLFAGSWDRTIWSWDIDSRAAGRKYVGHGDFVKAVVCTRVSGTEILISGGADKSIIVWEISTGRRLHTLQDSVQNMLAVQSLVIDPVKATNDETWLVSASSDPHIRRWRIRLDSWDQVVDPPVDARSSERRTILEHQTGIYKLIFDYTGDEVDLWTSSADGTTKCLSRLKNFASDDTFQHGDHVRAVAVTDDWVITAGRDEDLKFWDRTSGKLHATLEGHYDEITDLVILNSRESCVSVGIDGTVRTWPLSRSSIDEIRREQEVAAEGEKQSIQDEAENSITAEEEAELAALMDED